MPTDSAAIDTALAARLLADTTLMALMPDGVYFDEAKQGAQRFLIVSLVDEVDEAVFGGRAIEDALYLVKAVELGKSGVNADAAAARIEVLLNEQPLSATGYTGMATFRESRVRLTEVDGVDPSIRWQHRGGHYRVQMSL